MEEEDDRFTPPAMSTRWCSHTSCSGNRFRSVPLANRRCCRLAHLPVWTKFSEALQPDPCHLGSQTSEQLPERNK